MKTFNRSIAATVSVLAALALTLTGCTSTSDPEPTVSSESQEVADAYTEMVEATFNHGLVYDDFIVIQDETATQLGADGNNYEAAIEYLSTVVPLDRVIVDEDASNGISDVYEVLSLMITNTYEDTITAKVDLSKVNTDGSETATIDYSGVTFSSEKNDETGMADYLNQAYELPGEVKLHKVDGTWKVDASTVVPLTGAE